MTRKAHRKKSKEIVMSGEKIMKKPSKEKSKERRGVGRRSGTMEHTREARNDNTVFGHILAGTDKQEVRQVNSPSFPLGRVLQTRSVKYIPTAWPAAASILPSSVRL